MSNRITRPVVLPALLVLLAHTFACGGDGPSGPNPNDADGIAQFSYLGSGFDGDFKAVGKFERDGAGAMKHQSFATAVDVTLPQYQLAYYGIVAAHFYPPELDDLSILLSGQSRGEYPIKTAEDCSALIDLGTASCSAIAFDFHLSTNGSYAPEASSFELVDGLVTVTSVTGGRITGTFSGIARQFGDWMAGELYVPDVEVEITAGTFDVPIITLDHWTGSRLSNPNILAPLRSLLRH